MRKFLIFSILIFTVFLTGCSKKENSVITGNEDNYDITITAGDTIIYGTLEDSDLANEIKSHFPLEVSMVRYGTREFYGGIDFTPENISGGKKTFENGDITYCDTNNTLAIFYNDSEIPDLTMDVIKIGEVTSDLSVFDELDSTTIFTFDFTE